MTRRSRLSTAFVNGRSSHQKRFQIISDKYCERYSGLSGGRFLSFYCSYSDHLKHSQELLANEISYCCPITPISAPIAAGVNVLPLVTQLYRTYLKESRGAKINYLPLPF